MSINYSDLHRIYTQQAVADPPKRKKKKKRRPQIENAYYEEPKPEPVPVEVEPNVIYIPMPTAAPQGPLQISERDIRRIAEMAGGVASGKYAYAGGPLMYGTDPRQGYGDVLNPPKGSLFW